MQSTSSVPLRSLVLPLLLIALPGCAGMGTLGDILSAGGLYGNELVGEIRSVDTRRQEIQLQSDWGRGDRVRYDNRTVVIYRQRRYSVRDLERGDLVRVRVDQNRRGEPYATLIQVQQSVQDARRSGGQTRSRVQRLDGTVGRVDTQRGWFELHASRGPAMLVSLPYQTSRSMNDRFRRLRRGSRIRIEGQIIDQTRVELVRFL